MDLQQTPDEKVGIQEPTPTPAIPELPVKDTVTVAPDTAELNKDNCAEGPAVETDSNNYSLMQVIQSCDCEKDNIYKSVGLIYDTIDLKKFFVFVSDSSLAFKQFSRELDNFTRTVCYDEQGKANEVFNKICDYINATQVLPATNGEIIVAAMTWVKPEIDVSAIAPSEDEPLPDFTPVNTFTDYYDSKEPGQKELETTPPPSDK